MRAPPHTPLGRLACAAALLVGAAGCESSTSEPAASEPVSAESRVAPPGRGAPGVVEVVATGMSFTPPQQVPSGWTTFRFSNKTGQTHFFVLERLPEGKTVADSEREVVPVFQDAMDLIVAGDAEAGFAEFANLPPWFFEVAFVGGPGLVEPGGTAQTTVHLAPGTYAIECYVKTPDGTFHSALGMVAGLTVMAGPGGGREPEGSMFVTLSAEGMTLEGEPRPGLRTFAVRFEDQVAHEHFLGHDVHLARLEDDTDLEALSEWMDWSRPDGLTTPAPARFLGGTQELPAGSTAYFTARLAPGRYALIAEVPDPARKGMLVPFTVP